MTSSPQALDKPVTATVLDYRGTSPRNGRRLASGSRPLPHAQERPCESRSPKPSTVRSTRCGGLPPGAHMLVMCSSSTDSGGVLDGNSSDFDELVSHINEELADGLSASASRTLAAVCVKIDLWFA